MVDLVHDADYAFEELYDLGCRLVRQSLHKDRLELLIANTIDKRLYSLNPKISQNKLPRVLPDNPANLLSTAIKIRVSLNKAPKHRQPHNLLDGEEALIGTGYHLAD